VLTVPMVVWKIPQTIIVNGILILVSSTPKVEREMYSPSARTEFLKVSSVAGCGSPSTPNLRALRTRRMTRRRLLSARSIRKRTHGDIGVLQGVELQFRQHADQSGGADIHPVQETEEV
jgi:hypothetical protein